MKKYIVTIFIALCVFSLSLWVISNIAMEKGVSALKFKQYDIALRYLHPLAYLGFSDSQNIIGEMYAFGWGVEKDFDKSIYWYRKSGKWVEGDYDKAAPLAYYTGKRFMEESIHLHWNKNKQKTVSSEAKLWIKWSADHGYPPAVKLMEKINKVNFSQWETIQLD